MNFPTEILNSYELLFQNLTATGPATQEYLDLPIPWWLRTFDEQNPAPPNTPAHHSEAPSGNQHRLRSIATGLRSFIITKLRRDRVAHGQKTLRWLLQGSNGGKMRLACHPIVLFT